MTTAWAVPNTLPFEGLQPLDITVVLTNGNASTAMAVGDMVQLDLRRTRATKNHPGPGGVSGSIWSTVITPASAANQQAESWCITAVCLGQENGTASSVAAGEKGRFCIAGFCRMKLTNPDAAAITAPRPFAQSLAVSHSGVTNGTTTRIPANRRLYGFNIGNIAASEDGTILTNVYFFGFGIGTALEDAV
jgi:hypothetical protein